MAKFTVIRDTREKKGHGWHFGDNAYCEGTEITKLDIGDYSIKGKEDILCIERKESVAELAGNCGEKRFMKELKAMENYPFAFLLLEFNWHDIERYPEGSNVPKGRWKDLRIKGDYIMRVLTSVRLQGIQVIACGDKQRAEKTAFRIMRQTNEL